MSVIPWSVILDPRRLRELSDLKILDTPPEQTYDDLAGLARTICDTPVANVTLVAEDRQWFKSYIGSDVRETPIEQSVCAHALAETDALVINDLARDDRTRFNTLVTGETALRFYAGVPLRLDSDLGLGTLCVLDTKPHADGLSSAQIEALKALGRQATLLLKVRRYLAIFEDGHGDLVGSADPLQSIANALLTAYNINKICDDRVLEDLLSRSLMHVGRRIAQVESFNDASVH